MAIYEFTAHLEDVNAAILAKRAEIEAELGCRINITSTTVTPVVVSVKITIEQTNEPPLAQQGAV